MSRLTEMQSRIICTNDAKLQRVHKVLATHAIRFEAKLNILPYPLPPCMNNHSNCDPSNKAYKNGKTFDECKLEARKASSLLMEEISLYDVISWNRILEVSNHDELVYKLTLKYLRESGYDIGNHNLPRVTRRL